MGKRIALGFVFAFFLIGGLAHFVFTDLEVSIVPPAFPEPRLLVWISGVLELVGAVGLLGARTRRAAGVLLIIVAVAVTPANIYMLEHAESFPAVPRWLLIARLPAQLALIACIAWATDALRSSTAHSRFPPLR